MEKEFLSRNYVQLFSVASMPFLISSFSLEYYKKLKILEIYSEKNNWITYLPQETVKKTLNLGLKLYGDQELFRRYREDFSNYKKESRIFFEELSKKSNFSKTDIVKFFKMAAKLWKYYQFTEFFYVDKVYAKKKENVAMRQNLKYLEKIKTFGREYMNEIIFNQDCFLSIIIIVLEKQFNIKREYLWLYHWLEIVALFENKKISKRILEQRNQAYVFLQDDELVVLQGADAKKFINNFLSDKEISDPDSLSIKGIIASKGKVIGRARVMKHDYHDFKSMNRFMHDMKKGEILVVDTTSPRISLVCEKAAGIITNQGGMMSHAAIIAREFKIPCIVGTKNSTEFLHDGDLVEVDADNGVVRILEKNKK